MAERVSVKIENRQLSLSNLDKVLYPVTGFTKGEVIDYYTRIAPVLLPHLADRPLTIKRYPNGVDKPFFFEKNAARGTPDWVRTESLPVPGSTMDRERDRLHRRRGVSHAGVARQLGRDRTACAAVALAQARARAAYGHHRVRPRPGTAGRHHPMLRGCPVAPGHSHHRWTGSSREDLRQQRACKSARRCRSATRNARRPMRRPWPARWSNLTPSSSSLGWRRTCAPARCSSIGARTTRPRRRYRPYSLRARERPTVSTPLGWEEVEAGPRLSFTAGDVLHRVEDDGDLFAPTLDDTARSVLPKREVTGE